MSSFGGETPVNVPSNITTLANGVLYTVPSGRYARLIVYATWGTGGTGTSPILDIGALRFIGNPGLSGLEVVLTQGQTIEFQSGNEQSPIVFQISRIEYNNP